VLEPSDQPEKPKKFSKDQIFALNLLEQMIADGREWVEKNDGSGVPYDLWRDRVNELRKDKDGNDKPYSKSGWTHFVDRLLTFGVINKINNLVSINVNTSTEHQQ
jgi:hypothetical protein